MTDAMAATGMLMPTFPVYLAEIQMFDQVNYRTLDSGFSNVVSKDRVGKECWDRGEPV